MVCKMSHVEWKSASRSETLAGLRYGHSRARAAIGLCGIAHE
jgi:hypothetical protein